MAKIETYSLATSPLSLSDMLIGTEVGGAIPNATKNFSLGELLDLFSSSFPATTLQGVLDNNNTATQNINLTGIINTTFVKPINITDVNSSNGVVGQFLSKQPTGVMWMDVDALPSQVGQGGKYLTTNGFIASWSIVDTLPSQAGQGGKYLTTNGTTASWASVSVGLTNANIFVGNASNIATGVVLTLSGTSGAFGLSNTGVLTIPDANGTTTRGFLGTGAQTIGGIKTFSSAPIFSSILSGGATQFRLLSTNSSGLLNNTPNLIWDSNIGGLGIGTTPLYALDVSGTARINTQLYLTGSLTDSTSFTGIKMLTRRTSDGLTMIQDIPSLTAGTSYHAQYFSYTTQSAVTNNVGIPMFFETLDMSNGITVVSDGGATSPNNLTKITFANTGRYNLQFSTQFQNSDNAEQDTYIWLRKNGTTSAADVVGSTGIVAIPKTHGGGAGTPGHTIVSWNFLLDVIAGDFYQIVWSTADVTKVTIEFYSSTVNHPSTASTLFTVTQVEGILGGSGVQSIQGISPATASGNYGLVPDNDASILGGTDFNISYGATPLQSPGNIFFYIPTLGTGKVRGLITNAAQTIGGAKTFSSAPNLSSLTASQILALDASKNIQSLPVATYPSLTELTYVKGVTSAIQTQLNNKQSLNANITSLAGLSYVSTSFVKMTAAGTFTLDTTLYQTQLSFGSGLTNTGGTVTNTLTTGIAGTQTITGSTSPGLGLILRSTSDATKGQIFFGSTSNSAYNESTNRLGLGTINPNYKLEVIGTGRFSSDLTLSSAILTSGGSAGTSGQVLTSGGSGANFSWTNVQQPITLTTTGTSGAATFIGNTLNIPQYAGGVTQIIAGTNVTISPIGGTGAVTINSSGGGGGTPAGATGDIQFNSSGSFAANSNLFWDDGNEYLGIGTASPSYKLDVNGMIGIPAIEIDGTTAAFGLDYFAIRARDADTGIAAVFQANGDPAGYGYVFQFTASTISNGLLFVGNNLDQTHTIATDAYPGGNGWPLSFRVANTNESWGAIANLMTLTPDQKIGIGTDSPTNKLYVFNNNSHSVATFEGQNGFPVEIVTVDESLSAGYSATKGSIGNSPTGLYENMDGSYTATSWRKMTRPYRSYVAQLTQASTSAPTATILENDLGYEPTWTRNGAGLYVLSSTELTDENWNKVVVFYNIGNYPAAEWTTNAIFQSCKWSKEEGLVVLYTGIKYFCPDGGTSCISVFDNLLEDGILSDEDNFFPANIELRIYD
jgi:hypothetical protein